MLDDPRPDGVAPPLYDVEHARRKPGRGGQLREAVRGERRDLARLGDHGVPGGEGRCNLPGEEVERQVPGRDASHDAPRPSKGVVHPLLAEVEEFPVFLSNRIGEETEVCGGSRNLEITSEGERLPLVSRFQPGQLIAIGVDRIREGMQHGGSLVDRSATPCREGLGRDGDRPVDLFGGTDRHRTDLRGGGGIDHRDPWLVACGLHGADETRDLNHVALTPFGAYPSVQLTATRPPSTGRLTPLQ